MCTPKAMLKSVKVVALDTTENLLAAFSRRVLRLRLSSGVLPAEIAAVAQLDPTGRHMVPIGDYSQVGDVLLALKAAGASIADMEVTEPDLEDVFLKIMRREEALTAARAAT